MIQYKPEHEKLIESIQMPVSSVHKTMNENMNLTALLINKTVGM